MSWPATTTPAPTTSCIPGVVQQHDLQAVGGVADQDWYRISRKPYSSYEVVVDGVGETLANIPANSTNDHFRLELVSSGGGLLGLSGGASTIGSSRRLIVRNTGPTEMIDDYVRVQSAVNGCGTNCTSGAIYRISMRETTMFAPRFNNSGTQITVLILQNTHNNRDQLCGAFLQRGRRAAGDHTASINGRGSNVIQTAAIPELVGTSGTITMDHSAPYSALIGKAVALEPATGFSFDTPLVPKLSLNRLPGGFAPDPPTRVSS